MDEARSERPKLQQIGRRLGEWPVDAAAALHRMAQRLSQAAAAGIATASSATSGAASAGGAADDEMARLAGIIRSAQAHGERAGTCHDSAGRRIDAALDELEQLRSELAAVIDPALLVSPDLPRDDGLRRPSPAEVRAAPAPRARSAA